MLELGQGPAWGLDHVCELVLEPAREHVCELMLKRAGELEHVYEQALEQENPRLLSLDCRIL